MANRMRLLIDETRRAERQVAELSQALRDARLAAGLRQSDIARALGTSDTWVGRLEHGDLATTVVDLARTSAAVGLRLSLKLYPGPIRLRDGAQVALIERFLAELGGLWQARLEVPVGEPGDLRAVDLVLGRSGRRIAVEALTRLRDLQAQIRRGTLIQRDGNFVRLILLIADTRANRGALREAERLVQEAFPVGTRGAMAALRAGQLPAGNAIVMR